MTDDAPSLDATPPASVAPPPAGRSPLHWLLEGLFIVVSVALGFTVSEYGKARDDRELARRMLTSIQAEIEHNRRTLEPFIPIHRAWRGAGSLRQALAGDPRRGPVIAAQAGALARAWTAIATVLADSNAPCIHEL